VARVEETEGREDTENSNVWADRGTENSDFLAARTPCIACSTLSQADKDFLLRKQLDDPGGDKLLGGGAAPFLFLFLNISPPARCLLVS